MASIKQYTTHTFQSTDTYDKVDFVPDISTERGILNIYPEVTYQTVMGFGGAFTEAAAYCYAALSPEEKERLLRAYFSEDGLGYRICRTHINSCDFALDRYVYVEDGDTELKTFSIQRDAKYIIPFIKDAMRYTGEGMTLFASPWTAPHWMKTNGSMIAGGKVKPEYRDVWANYYCKYIRAFEEQGITISAITVQNEPKAIQTWESLEYTGEEEGLFIRDHLYPALKANGLSHIKILVWDHNKERVYDRARDIFSVPGVRELVWGIGFHWYSGSHYDALDVTHTAFPEKVLWETEYCKVLDPKYENFGFDDNPLSYGEELHGNFMHGMQASVDWNLMLDYKGGPYHDRQSGCKAPVMVDTEKGCFVYSDIYFNLWHFAHFIKVGAVRVGSSSFDKDVLFSAYQNPDGQLVAVAINQGKAAVSARIRLGKETAPVALPPKSISTFVVTE